MDGTHQPDPLNSAPSHGGSARTTRKSTLHGGRSNWTGGPNLGGAGSMATSILRGTHAIHEGTHTDEDEGDANHADPRPPSSGERGSKRKADEPPRPSRWIGPHGITEQEAQELETDSFLADLGEVAEMATLPLPTMPEDTAEATTVPWTAAALGENSQLSAPTRPRSEGEGEDPDSSPESHRRRRLHSVHFNRHGPM